MHCVSRTSTNQLIWVKLQIFKDNNKVSKSNREERQVTHRKTALTKTAGFLQAATKAKSLRSLTLKVSRRRGGREEEEEEE